MRRPRAFEVSDCLGTVSQTWVARPKQDINLNPGVPSHSGDAPGLGLRTQILVTDWLRWGVARSSCVWPVFTTLCVYAMQLRMQFVSSWFSRYSQWGLVR